jgi:hypothetical protein
MWSGKFSVALIATAVLAGCQSGEMFGGQASAPILLPQRITQTVEREKLRIDPTYSDGLLYYCEPPACRSDMSVTFGGDGWLRVPVNLRPNLAASAASNVRDLGERSLQRFVETGAITHFQTRTGVGFTIAGVTTLKDATGTPRSVKHHSTITFVYDERGKRWVVALAQDRTTSLRLGSRRMVD